ncbi:hypothetical protein RFI_01700, partial [Reticulomyxa filosa]
MNMTIREAASSDSNNRIKREMEQIASLAESTQFNNSNKPDQQTQIQQKPAKKQDNSSDNDNGKGDCTIDTGRWPGASAPNQVGQKAYLLANEFSNMSGCTHTRTSKMSPSQPPISKIDFEARRTFIQLECLKNTGQQ